MFDGRIYWGVDGRERGRESERGCITKRLHCVALNVVFWKGQEPAT